MAMSENVVWVGNKGTGSHVWGNASYWHIGTSVGAASNKTLDEKLGIPYPNNDDNYTFNVYIPSDTVTRDLTDGVSPENAAITISSLNIGTSGQLVVSGSGAALEVTGQTTLDDDTSSLAIKNGGDFVT